MLSLQIQEIIKPIGGDLISRTPLLKVKGISTDTRTLLGGDLFIALKGENFDGHSFLEEAFKKGAIGAIVSKKFKIQNSKFKNKIIIKVKDTLKALEDIAKIYREKFNISVIAVTGSNGKTTTKEMLSYILSGEFKTVKSKASFNNFIGVPLSLLEIKKDTQVVILEMETNLLGGIRRLCEIARPSTGIVTNIGDTHLEYLKTKEAVFKEKSELIESLPGEGTAVLNFDDPYVVRMKELAKTKRVITFGIENKANFLASEIKRDAFVEFTLNPVRCGLSKGVNANHKVRLNTIFYKNVYNALAAIAVSHSVFDLSLEMVIAKLREFRFPPRRMETIDFSTKGRFASGEKDIKIINDSYNANPQSMQEALFTLKNINPVGYRLSSGANTSGRRIAVLGDMLELGEKALDFHYRTGKLVAACQIDILVTVGNLARHIANGAKEGGIPEENIFIFDNNEKAGAMLATILRPVDTILVKGSRKMKMERIIDTLTASSQR